MSVDESSFDDGGDADFNKARKCAKFLRSVTQSFGLASRDVFALYDYTAVREDEMRFVLFTIS